MERITSYEQLKELAAGALKPGVLTNTALCGRDFAPYIDAGLACCEAGSYGLLIVRDKGPHNYVNFYLSAGKNAGAEELSDMVRALPLPPKCLLEVAYRDRDVQLKALAEAFRGQGFEKVLGRIRYVRPAGPEVPEPEPVPLEPGTAARFIEGADCDKEDMLAAIDFISSNFSRLTGCWPVPGEMRFDRWLEIKDDAGICALLHCQTDGQMPNVRHMAVREDCRGRRLTSKLLSRFCASLAGSRAMVWVKEHDEPAMRAYSKYGFAPDGRESGVLYRE